MPNYQQAKIYTIRSPSTDEVYVGSTCEPTLARRMAGHRGNFKKWKNKKTNYTSSFKLLELGNAYIELLENYPCGSKDELHKREGELIRGHPNCVNMCIAGRTKAEYYADNKDKVKQYQQANKEKIAARVKQYQQANKDKLKQYREDNRERIKANKKKKYNCQCGGRYTRSGKSLHFKTQKHKAYETQLNATVTKS